MGAAHSDYDKDKEMMVTRFSDHQRATCHMYKGPSRCWLVWPSHANKSAKHSSVSGIRLALQQFCWLDPFLTRSLVTRSLGPR